MPSVITSQHGFNSSEGELRSWDKDVSLEFNVVLLARLGQGIFYACG